MHNDDMKKAVGFFSLVRLVGIICLLIPHQVFGAQYAWDTPAGVTCDKAVHSSSFTDLASKVTGSVVAIICSGSADRSTPVFNDLGRIFPNLGTDDRSLGIGSGFVIGEDGLIVTNEHVISGAKKVWVIVEGLNRKLPAQIIGSDSRSDVALLKIHSPKPLRALVLGNSDYTEVGQWVMTMGNPYGLSHLVTKGVISGKGRAIGGLPHGKYRFLDFLQTDAAINRGNSGGPLFDLCGHVVGICTAINSKARGLGFAVPANLLRAVLPHLYEKGHLDRAYLGINVDDVGWELAQSLGMDTVRGVVITRVRPGTPADKAGLRTGDVILKMGAFDVQGRTDLTWKVATLPAETPAKVVIWREGKLVSITVIPSVRKKHSGSDHDRDGALHGPVEKQNLGLKVMDSTDAGRGAAVNGVVVVKAEALAAEHGLRPGDMIVEINGSHIESSAELNAVLRKIEMGNMIRFYVVRQGVGHFVALRKSWED